MSIENERKLFEEWFSSVWDGIDLIQTIGVECTFHYENGRFYREKIVQQHWLAWQASANREGFVLVPKDKVTVFWQDDDEPENFVEKESDFDILGDGVDVGDIVVINKHIQANISTEKLYGTWECELVCNATLKSRFFVGTYKECLRIKGDK